MIAAVCDDLIQNRFGIPHASISFSYDITEDLFIEGDPFLGADALHLLNNLCLGDPSEIEPLASGHDGIRDFLWFSRREDEDVVAGRLLQRLEQCVKRLRR